MKMSSPVFEERNFFHSKSIVTLEDFPQLTNRVRAKNCSSVLLLLFFQGAFAETPFSTHEFAPLLEEVVPCFQPTVLSCLRGAPRSEWIRLKTNLLGSKGSGRCTVVSCCRREVVGLHHFKLMEELYS